MDARRKNPHMRLVQGSRVSSGPFVSNRSRRLSRQHPRLPGLKTQANPYRVDSCEGHERREEHAVLGPYLQPADLRLEQQDMGFG